MDKPLISYLVSCHNEGKQVEELLNRLLKYSIDNECIVLDDYSDDETTINVLNNIKSNTFFNVVQHKLNNNYSEHKNYGKSLCKGTYIFQLDSDELPSETLLENLPEIIALNPNVELFWIPRINDFRGVTADHARHWGWRLTEYDGRLIVNYPDFQGRLFKHLPHINWQRRLHEKVEGANVVTFLPTEFDLSIVHNKTIEKQVETNIRYNKQFTEDENKGFKI